MFAPPVLSEPRVRLNTGTGGSQFGGVPVDFALLRNHILQVAALREQGYASNHRVPDPRPARFSSLPKVKDY